MYAAPMARADLVHSLGLDAVRAALIRRAAAWMARQRRRIAGEGRWQEGWPRTGWGLLVDAGLAEAGDDEVTTPIAAPDLGPRLGPVCTRLGLAPAAAEFLAGLVVAAIDVEVARVWHALAPVPSAPAYTFGAWIEVLGDDDERRQALLAVLSPDHPLRRLRIVELGDGPPWAAPIAAVPEALVGLTVGAPVHAPIPAITDVVLTEAELGQLGQLAASAPRRVVFVGRTGSGRRTRAALLASRLGRAASAIHGADPAVLAARLRDALFADAVPVVQLAADASPAWWHQLASFEGALILVADPAAAGDLLRRLAGTVEVTIAPLSAAAQRRLWTQRLAGASEPVDDTVLDTVVAAYDLPPGDVDHLAQRLRSAGRRIGVVDVRDALRSASTTELWGLAQPYRTVHTWADVILPDSTQHLLTELIAHLRHRATVFESWGFGAILPYGRAVSALLAGPPGTGKTMAASLIAQELGLELFRIDLSKIVSKWLGETEKNLGLVFDEAERVGAVLLFDEADALFARRTEVKSSNDRTANLAGQLPAAAPRAAPGRGPADHQRPDRDRRGLPVAACAFASSSARPDRGRARAAVASRWSRPGPRSPTDVDLTEVAERVRPHGGRPHQERGGPRRLPRRRRRRADHPGPAAPGGPGRVRGDRPRRRSGLIVRDREGAIFKRRGCSLVAPCPRGASCASSDRRAPSRALTCRRARPAARCSRAGRRPARCRSRRSSRTAPAGPPAPGSPWRRRSRPPTAPTSSP
jgi:hypothetical protein